MDKFCCVAAQERNLNCESIAPDDSQRCFYESLSELKFDDPELSTESLLIEIATSLFPGTTDSPERRHRCNCPVTTSCDWIVCHPCELMERIMHFEPPLKLATIREKVQTTQEIRDHFPENTREA